MNIRLPIILALATLSYTTAASFQGINVGAQLGYTSSTHSVKKVKTFNLKPTDKFNQSKAGLLGGGFVSYIHKFRDRFYLGVEGEYNMAGYTSNSAISGADPAAPGAHGLSIKRMGEMNGALLAGYAFDNKTLAYGRLGYGMTKYKIQASHASVSGDPATSSKVSKTFSGINLGLGAQLALTNSFHMALDFVHAFSSGKKILADMNSDNDAASGTARTYRVKSISQDSIRVRFIYHFGM